MLYNATNANELLESLANDLKPLVTDIERSFATTKNHYGDYMNLICQLSKNDKRMAKVISLSLIKAGGNKDGILSAMQLI